VTVLARHGNNHAGREKSVQHFGHNICISAAVYTDVKDKPLCALGNKLIKMGVKFLLSAVVKGIDTDEADVVFKHF